jgi:hypothetical protein
MGRCQAFSSSRSHRFEGLYLLVIVQHITLIAALTYTTIALTANRNLRCLLALLLGSFSALYTHAHCCGSEALSVAATFALLAAGASIVRGSGPAAWIVYGAALFLAIGSRAGTVVARRGVD